MSISKSKDTRSFVRWSFTPVQFLFVSLKPIGRFFFFFIITTIVTAVVVVIICLPITVRVVHAESIMSP